MPNRQSQELILLPAIKAGKLPSGGHSVTEKFIDGVDEYLNYWDGPIRVLMEEQTGSDSNLDRQPIDPAALDFKLEIVSYQDPSFVQKLKGASLVHGFADHHQNEMPRLCRSIQVPFVSSTEYSLRTRIQIAKAQQRNPLRLARRCYWEWQQEGLRRKAISQAQGLQCNGTPTYDSYKGINSRTLLYFDTRTRADMIVSEQAIVDKYQRMGKAKPLQLAFSGRLEEMKGVNYLPKVALELKNLQVDFELHISGAGSQEQKMRKQVRELGLEREVRFHGVLDYKSELVPFISENVDLFVCPHVQGDPSCTYLETLACGVPIIGFDNEALTGILRRESVGVATPMKDPKRLAQGVVELGKSPARLERYALNGRSFASNHTFEKCFAERIDHMKSCL